MDEEILNGTKEINKVNKVNRFDLIDLGEE